MARRRRRRIGLCVFYAPGSRAVLVTSKMAAAATLIALPHLGRVSRTSPDEAPVPYIEQPAETATALAGQFSLRNACVTFYNTSTTTRRAHFVSLEGVSAFVHGFNEFQQGFRRLAIIRPVSGAQERETLRDRCPRRPLGLAMSFSTDNMGHQLRHAPADYAVLREHLSADADLIPVASHWAGLRWDHAPTFRSFAWEFTVRSLSAATPEQLTTNLRRLLTPPYCACYDRIEGSVSEHNPYAMHEEARRTQRNWRAAALANAALLLTAEQAAAAAFADRQLLYIARAVGTRVVSNGAELVRELRVHHPRVRHVVLERLPVAQQMMTVASSAGLIGAHGSGLVWTTFLPAGSRPTAVIEMLPRTNSIYWSYALIFPDLCAPLGVRHWTVRAELTPTPTCKPKGSRKGDTGSPLRCNLTVQAPELLRAVRHAEEWIATAAAPKGPALYDSWRLLTLSYVHIAPWGVPLAALPESKAAPEWLAATQRPLTTSKQAHAESIRYAQAWSARTGAGREEDPNSASWLMARAVSS